ncbi:SpaH/EbpB family LPXTG-anchored major pilin [Leucobacter salsicius]|uniref:SpaH/EbpB family LPXTG-anchored major pilin n=1 Tax=Leucobacter salsicius TaxID=664638 RepID=UPI00037A29A1|nr:SpaH/EbpB family LPXTG-anchored major pilin [Leucobacter salsicius]
MSMQTRTHARARGAAHLRGRSTMVVLGVLFAMFFALLPAQAATATTVDPDAVTAIEIHKFEQPDSLGAVADGLPKNTTGLTPVAGVTFTAKLVPGLDLTTNAGQKAATKLTAEKAAARVAGQPVAATDVTDTAGNATLAPLGVGLYYVQETTIPAGYVGAAPFLVALPLTNPVERDGWLNTVHVYPKNAKAGITLDVIDQDAVKLGDTVHWTSHSTIPLQPTLDGYMIEEVITPKLRLIGPPATLAKYVPVRINCDNCPALAPGTDYTVTYNDATRTIIVNFLEPGLRKLEQVAQHYPGATVQVDYDTTVLAEGIHVNEAILYPSQAAIEARLGVNDTATTKWGPLSVIVHEHGNPSNLIPGARFKVYLTPEDALAQRNPIVIEGVQEWTTDAQGRLIVNGLRFSDFVNGLDRETGDPLYRYYWAAPTHIPPGWTWIDDRPLSGSVNSEVEYQTLIFQVTKPVEPSVGVDPRPTPENPQGLPVTGAQIAGIGVLAAALIGLGALLFLRRRRSGHDSLDSLQ